MPENRTRTNLVPMVLLLGGIGVIYVFDRVTHQDVIAAVATILFCSVFVARWLFRGRRF